jgi:hypothetical protein
MLALRASDARRAIRVLSQAAGVRRAALFGDDIHVTLESRAGDWQAATQALATANIDVSDVHEIEPSLEDVFMDRVADVPRS